MENQSYLAVVYRTGPDNGQDWTGHNMRDADEFMSWLQIYHEDPQTQILEIIIFLYAENDLADMKSIYNTGIAQCPGLDPKILCVDRRFI